MKGIAVLTISLLVFIAGLNIAEYDGLLSVAISTFSCFGIVMGIAMIMVWEKDIKESINELRKKFDKWTK